MILALVLVPLALVIVLVVPRWVALGSVGLLSTLGQAAYVLGIPFYAIAAVVFPLLRSKPLGVRLRSARAFASVTIAAASIALLAVLWSSRVDTSVTTAATWLAILLLSLLCANMIISDGFKAVGKFLAMLLPAVVAQALTTVIFRFNPSVEEGYYRSSFSRLFLGSGGQAMYTTDLTNNVLNPERAGGFLFVNLNRASMVMGVMLMAYLVYGWISRRRWVWFAIIPLALAIAVGGSKTGLALLVVLPVYSAILAAASRSDKAAQRMGIVLVALLASSIAVQIVLFSADDYVEASEATLLPRLQLWSEALRAIAENWLGGLGFGGWYERWEAGGVNIAFSMRPAHNWVLQAWLDGGILYLATTVAFVVVVLVMQLRAVRSAEAKHMKLALAFAGSGLLWPIIHAMGDNSPVFGDPPALTFIAVLAAILLVSDPVSKSQNYLSDGERNATRHDTTVDEASSESSRTKSRYPARGSSRNQR